jgi:dTDP-4-dehydrorhamnose 3,5-epimerase
MPSGFTAARAAPSPRLAPIRGWRDRRSTRTAAMIFEPCPVAGAWVVRPQRIADFRGYFMRAWCADEFAAHGIPFDPVQSNMAFSALRGTIRGLHYQVAPALEAKLVRCTRGAIFDVVLDMRPESPTYRRWHATHLSADNGNMLYVPEGCAHGCQTLENDSELLYMVSARFAGEHVRGIRFDDPAFAIEWPLPPGALSEQDRSWPLVSSI